MVENLTLSKMSIHLNGADVGQPERFICSLEEQKNDRAPAIKLTLSYHLAGRALNSASKIRLCHTGRFECTLCHSSVKKLFDGFCYPCLQKSAQADRCVLNPVGCHYTAGTCREPQWGQDFCYQPHFVYISFTDKFKVGITRRQQVPVRWIDQGATMAVLIAAVGSRHQAGLLEDFLTSKFADKSHWQKMLKSGNQRPTCDEIRDVRETAIGMLEAALSEEAGVASCLRAPVPAVSPLASEVRLLRQSALVELEFPLWNPLPEKIVSVNLDKSPSLESAILGIKGQYLFLEQGVFNVRRHEGYVVNCEFPV